MEELMIDIMYELPDQETEEKYTITDGIVEGKSKLFKPGAKRKKAKKEPA